MFVIKYQVSHNYIKMYYDDHLFLVIFRMKILFKLSILWYIIMKLGDRTFVIFLHKTFYFIRFLSICTFRQCIIYCTITCEIFFVIDRFAFIRLILPPPFLWTKNSKCSRNHAFHHSYHYHTHIEPEAHKIKLQPLLTFAKSKLT